MLIAVLLVAETLLRKTIKSGQTIFELKRWDFIR